MSTLVRVFVTNSVSRLDESIQLLFKESAANRHLQLIKGILRDISHRFLYLHHIVCIQGIDFVQQGIQFQNAGFGDQEDLDSYRVMRTIDPPVGVR